MRITDRRCRVTIVRYFRAKAKQSEAALLHSIKGLAELHKKVNKRTAYVETLRVALRICRELKEQMESLRRITGSVNKHWRQFAAEVPFEPQEKAEPLSPGR